MFYAVIAGDIVASTSLSDSDRQIIASGLVKLFKTLDYKFEVYGRNIQGDYIECVIPAPGYALRVALIIKSFVKALSVNEPAQFLSNKKAKKFRTHGIRLAIGLGELSRFDRGKGIIDGEAIYLAGREINKYSTYDKERIVIKDSLFLSSNHKEKYEMYDPMLSLIDELINKATPRQCQVLQMKLLDMSEEEIADNLDISQPAVNKHSRGIGWNAIEKTVSFFEKSLSK